MKHSLFITGLLLFLTSLSSNAGIISGVTAASSTGNIGFADTNVQNTVNGVGLSALDLNATHSPTFPDNSYVSNNGIPVFTFDLGGLYTVDGFSFWNQNSGGPSTATGLNAVEVLTSTDGIGFSSLGLFNFAEVFTGVSAPEIFNFTAVSATHFQFDVQSNHGESGLFGFAEVQFASVPEPSILALLLGLSVAVSIRRSWCLNRN